MAGHSKWANIKHRKARQDAVRGKIFTKISREIYVAVKNGGPEPENNPRLKAAVQKARSNNIPMDNIQRVIAKANGNAEGVNYEEFMYEGYGPAGVAVMMKIMTDNRNRTAPEIRHTFSKNGGSMGENGCVSWMFDQKGQIIIDKGDLQINEDEFMLEAIEAGADDVQFEEDSILIYTEPAELMNCREALETAGYSLASAEVTMVPQNTVAVSGDNAKKMLKLMDMLEDNDDVQDVWANFDLDDSELE